MPLEPQPWDSVEHSWASSRMLQPAPPTCLAVDILVGVLAATSEEMALNLGEEVFAHNWFFESFRP